MRSENVGDLRGLPRWEQMCPLSCHLSLTALATPPDIRSSHDRGRHGVVLADAAVFLIGSARVLYR